MNYAVGDLQGCLAPLQHLLAEVAFNPSQDQLWLVGDLVNRGPDSLGCLELVIGLGNAARLCLGNHDLHLLALLEGTAKPKSKDTLTEILDHPKAYQFRQWLADQPLVQQNQQFFVSHAGLPPCWSLEQASSLAAEVSQVLKLPSLRREFLAQMYGNEPNPWHNQLQGMARLRCITNYFTRMRYCGPDGLLDFSQKESFDQPPAGMKPWFDWWPSNSLSKTLIFGHWAALQGQTQRTDIIGLDTGCVWGGDLTLMCLESGERLGCRLDGSMSQF